MRIFKIVLIVSVLLLGIGLVSANAHAVEISPECSKCHDNPYANPSFFKLPLVADGSTSGSVVNKRACQDCHWETIGLQHFPSFKTVTVTVYGTVYGDFKAPDSIYQTPQYLHTIHNGPKRQVGTSCASCHAVVSCQTCHRSVLHENHYMQTKINPKTKTGIITPTLSVVNGIRGINQLTSCATAECHKTLPGPVTANPDNSELCSNCHWIGSSGHDLKGVHNSSYVPSPVLECSKCHDRDLTAEHQRRLDRNNSPLDCLTCHKSVKPEVVSAIKNNQKQCDICHARYDHLAVHTNSVDGKCQTCHKDNLFTEHMDNGTTQGKGFSCATCHENKRVDVTTAISSGTAQCTSCHSEGHNLYLIGKVPQDIPLNSGFSWSTPQEAAIWSGEPWLDDSYLTGGKRVLSNRKNLTDQQFRELVSYYQSMTGGNMGWTSVSEQVYSRGMAVLEFTKGNRRAQIAIYEGEGYNQSPAVTTGYRIDILYK